MVPDGSDEAVDFSGVLDAFTDGVDVGVFGEHLVVDEDGAFDGKGGGFGEFGVGADSGGDDDHVAGEFGAVFEFEAADGAFRGGEDFRGGVVAVNGDAEGGDDFSKGFTAGGVELDGHEVRGHLDDVDGGAMIHETFGRFESEEAAADDGGDFGGFGPVGDGGAIVDGAEDEYALEVGSGDGRHEGAGAGGDDEFVVGNLPFVGHDDGTHEAVDSDGGHTCEEADVVLFVPLAGVEGDFFFGVGAVEDVGEEDAVVVSAGFGTDDGDVERERLGGVGVAFEDFFGDACASHAVAEDDEFGFGCSDHDCTTLKRELRVRPRWSCDSGFGIRGMR